MNGSGVPNRTRVRLRVWGVTDADAEHAVDKAGLPPSRRGWDFADVQRVDGARCPIDVNDPKTIAADAGERWAYAVYPAAVDRSVP